MKLSNVDLPNSTANIYREFLDGANVWSNYLWSLILFTGGLGFFLAGLGSYFQVNFFPLFNSTQLVFLPQGILLVFYGMLALLLSAFLLIWSFEKVGSGFNEYDLDQKIVRIFRKGISFFKNDIYLVYTFSEVQSIELEIIDSINPKRTLYLCLQDGRKIPLNPNTTFVELKVLENRGISLAKLLDVDLVLNKT